jgi:hypothetical protein
MKSTNKTRGHESLPAGKTRSCRKKKYFDAETWKRKSHREREIAWIKWHANRNLVLETWRVGEPSVARNQRPALCSWVGGNQIGALKLAGKIIQHKRENNSRETGTRLVWLTADRWRWIKEQEQNENPKLQVCAAHSVKNEFYDASRRPLNQTRSRHTNEKF